MYELSILEVLLMLIIPSVVFGGLILFCFGKVLHVPDLSLRRSLRLSSVIGVMVFILGTVELFISEYLVSPTYLSIYDSSIAYFNLTLIVLGTLFFLHERIATNRWKVLVLTFASILIGAGAGYVALLGAASYLF